MLSNWSFGLKQSQVLQAPLYYDWVLHIPLDLKTFNWSQEIKKYMYLFDVYENGLSYDYYMIEDLKVIF